jgi:hypothetical protein
MALWRRKEVASAENESKTMTELQQDTDGRPEGEQVAQEEVRQDVQEAEYPTGARLVSILVALFVAAFLTALDMSIIATVSFILIARQSLLVAEPCSKIRSAVLIPRFLVSLWSCE